MTDDLTATNTALLRLAGELVRAATAVVDSDVRHRMYEGGSSYSPELDALDAILSSIPPDLMSKIEEARGA